MMTTASNEIGKTLKQQRLSLELTLRELAARSGISASGLGRIERGNRFPSGHILRKIAKPLGLDESLLMTMAGYLSPESSSETGEEHRIYKGLDPYVANVLSEEPVYIQRAVLSLLTIVKAIQKPLEETGLSDKRGEVLSLLLDHPNASYEKIGSIVHCSRQWVHQIAKEAGLARKRRPPHYRSDVTVDKVLELYHRDLLIKEIAPSLGCCPSTVTKRLREAGISPSECFSRSMKLDWRGSYHCRDDITAERVLNLYHSDSLPIKEMAKTIGCDQVTVRKRLMEAGISKSERFSRGAVIRWERRKHKASSV